MKHWQSEAFTLMKYVCVICGHMETLWNSRNAIAPFEINCLKCDKKAVHGNWHDDEYAPDHIPLVGHRIFVDATDEDLYNKRQMFVDKHWKEKPVSLKSMYRGNKKQCIKDLVKFDRSFPNIPKLITLEHNWNEKLFNSATTRKIPEDNFKYLVAPAQPHHFLNLSRDSEVFFWHRLDRYPLFVLQWMQQRNKILNTGGLNKINRLSKTARRNK